MSRTRVSACALFVAASLAGCTGTGDVEYAGEVHVTSPELVYVSPGVQVVADADEPIFYAHGDYWLYRDGYWMRSNDYQRGYVRVEYTYVPQEVRVIERPQIYVQYRRNYGRDRAARTPYLRTRSQPTYQQPEQPTRVEQPVYPPPQPSQPAYRDPANPATSPTSPVYQPNRPNHPRLQPGANPTTPTPPPGASSPVVTPNDNRREPAPQREVSPDINRTRPGNSENAPGHNKPQAAPEPPAPPPGQVKKDAPDRERGNAPDKSDRATPPGQTKTDDRTKKSDEQKDKKGKKDKY